MLGVACKGSVVPDPTPFSMFSSPSSSSSSPSSPAQEKATINDAVDADFDVNVGWDLTGVDASAITKYKDTDTKRITNNDKNKINLHSKHSYEDTEKINEKEKVNLDVTALVCLCSDLTNPSVERDAYPYTLADPILKTMQEVKIGDSSRGGCKGNKDVTLNIMWYWYS